MGARISRWGDSLAVRLPKAVLDQLGLKEGQEVDLVVKEGEVRIRPVGTHPTLDELVAEMDRLGPDHEPEPIDWGPDVGAEIISDAYSRGEIVPDEDKDGS